MIKNLKIKKKSIVNKSVWHERIIIIYTHFQWLFLKVVFLFCFRRNCGNCSCWKDLVVLKSLSF